MVRIQEWLVGATFGAVISIALLLLPISFASPLQVFPASETANKFLAGAFAFAIGALGAGWAVGRAGAAGLAAAAERPEIRTFAIIITALGEAIAIYAIVIALLIILA